MIRLPEGVTVERSEREGQLEIRVRVLTQGLLVQPTNLNFRGDVEFIRDRMEEDVLHRVCGELDRLRLQILEALKA